MINFENVNWYCSEDISKIENYNAALNDQTQTWICHHRREISEGKSSKQLMEEDLYYGVPADDLIFLTRSEHTTLHNYNMREETLAKRSENWSGKMNPMKGKHWSEEHRKYLSTLMTGREISEETRKKRSAALTGRTFTDEWKHKLAVANSNVAINNEKNYYFWYLENGFTPWDIVSWEDIQRKVTKEDGTPYYASIASFMRLNKTIFYRYAKNAFMLLERPEFLKEFYNRGISA